MRKLVFGLLALIGLVTVFFAAEIVQLNPGADFIGQVSTDFAGLYSMVCAGNSARFSGHFECEKKLVKFYGPCLSPILSKTERSECFDRISSAINARVHQDLGNPNPGSDKVVAWAQRAAQDVMNFNYENIDERLNRAHAWFTPFGWNSFGGTLHDSDIIGATKSLKLRVTLSVLGAAQILQAVNNGGIYTWHLQFPISINFASDEKITPPRPIKAMLHLIIVRVPSRQSPDGIGIKQWATVSQ